MKGRKTQRLVGFCSAAVLAVMALGSAPACHKRGPKDVGNQNPRSEFEGAGTGHGADASIPLASSNGRVIASPTKGGRLPREIAKASARAITTSPTHVYFGNAEDDMIYRLAKAGTESVRIARRAPMPGAIAVDATSDEPALYWIGSPGDAILRAAIKGETAPPMTTVREGSVFANLVAPNGDLLWTEIHGGGGAIMRGASRAQPPVKLTSFEGAPRGIVCDETRVFLATGTRLLTTSRSRAGEPLTILATGSAFSSPCVDDTWLYATATDPRGGRGRVIGRVKKDGSGTNTFEVIATNVRDAPIAVRDGEVYWFDAERPVLFACSVKDPSASTRFVSEDPLLDQVYALAIDDDGAFLAVGYGEGGRILRVLLR